MAKLGMTYPVLWHNLLPTNQGSFWKARIKLNGPNIWYIQPSFRLFHVYCFRCKSTSWRSGLRQNSTVDGAFLKRHGYEENAIPTDSVVAFIKWNHTKYAHFLKQVRIIFFVTEQITKNLKFGECCTGDLCNAVTNATRGPYITEAIYILLFVNMFFIIQKEYEYIMLLLQFAINLHRTGKKFSSYVFSIFLMHEFNVFME